MSVQAMTSANPSTGETVWSGHKSTPDAVRTAFAAAAAAQPAWAALGLEARADILKAYAESLKAGAEDLAGAISSETGKPLWEARQEAAAAAGKIAISLGAYEERTPTRGPAPGEAGAALTHRPHGVMAVLGPYNFPLHLPNGHIVPALLAGNAVVFKPSEWTPMVGERMIRLLAEAGVPPGVLQLVQGTRETGEAMLADPALAGVLFTGSAKTGTAIHRRFAGRPEILLALEMGGNNPLVVADVADLDAAVDVTLFSAFVTAGQRCTCARRLILIDGPEADGFLERLTVRARALPVGPAGTDPEPFMGPLISAEAAAGVRAAEKALLEKGARALLPLQDLPRSPAFLRPGLIDVTDVADRPDDEVFGPLLQIVRVPDFETAMREANATRFGLAAGLLADDPALFDAFRTQARAGIVNWNTPLTGASSAAPFGGVGLSGNHRPAAYYAADYCAYPMASSLAPKLAPPSAPGLRP